MTITEYNKKTLKINGMKIIENNTKTLKILCVYWNLGYDRSTTLWQSLKIANKPWKSFVFIEILNMIEAQHHETHWKLQTNLENPLFVLKSWIIMIEAHHHENHWKLQTNLEIILFVIEILNMIEAQHHDKSLKITKTLKILFFI